MEIGQALKELREGNRVTRLKYGSSTHLEYSKGTLFKVVVNRNSIWTVTQEDVLANDYIIINN